MGLPAFWGRGSSRQRSRGARRAGSPRPCALAALAIAPSAVAISLVVPAALRAVTITEIHYDPPGEASGLEFVELHNDAPTVADISGWAFTEGIDTAFPRGTWIPGRGYLVVVGNEAAFRAAYPGVAVAGVFEGRLDSDGEELVLSDAGGSEAARVRYRDRGKWTSIPAGTGHTLCLRATHLDPSEPESWTASAFPGGTPGRANFAAAAEERELVALGATWSYRKGTVEFSDPPEAWRQRTYSAAGWTFGPAGFGYGDGDDATVLEDMSGTYMSVAVRTYFSMTQTGIDAASGLVLALSYDDGLVAYLNGVEVLRLGVPGAPGEPVPFDAAAASHEAGAEERFEISMAPLVAGTNLLAIQGHNVSIASSDFSLAPRLLLLSSTSPGGEASAVVFNEFLGRASGGRWVELYNTASRPVDLSGHLLSDSAAALDRHVLPSGTVIPPGGFLVVTEQASGLDLSAAEVRLFLTLPDRKAVAAAAIFENLSSDGIPASRWGYSDARFPDGTGDFGYAPQPTPGAPNEIDVSRDVSINEVFYNAPAGSTASEFIELFNRGAEPVDLTGWSFTKGVSFTFPAGAIPPGGYLVVAADPASLEAAHGIAGVLGPWSGSLSSSGENIRLADAAGNVADEVRYFDGGRWAQDADGGGSSLELIDPWQDNSFATAWEASDESGKSDWKELRYTGSYAPEAASELHVLLLDAGAVLIDDVSLKREGSPVEHIPNGGFETDTSPWLLQGTHGESRRTTLDARSGSACLELIATGPGDAGVNKADTDTSPAMTAGKYEVSFWARWLRGCSKLLTRADSVRGASLSKVHELELPAALGTPGRENSARVALRSASPDGNLGPVIGDVSQVPVAPGPASAVTVRARAHDSDGVASLAVHYRPGGVGDGVFAQAALFDDGIHGDGKAGDGVWAGTVPPHPLGTRVVFFLEGTDALGHVRRYPVEAPARTLLYGVQITVPSPLLTVRLNLDDENDATLRERLLHSDDLVDGSFVFEDREIYYNVGVRYRGSPWGRPGDPKNFRIRFNEDRPFIRGLRAVNLARSGWALNESTAFYCVEQASRIDSPAPASAYLFSRVFRNGAFHGQMGIVETVDARYVKRCFPRDPDGLVFKVAARPYLNDGGTMDAVEGTTFAYRGVSADFPFEAYRWYFVPGTRQIEDRWTELDRLCGSLDVNRTPPAAFDAAIEGILDVEQFLRVEAARTLQDDWDTIGIGGGHNAYLYHAPGEGRWKLLAWDMDNTFGNADAKLFPEGAEPQVTRLVQRPLFRRQYLRIVEQLLQGPWDAAYIQAYLAQVRSTTGLDPGGILNFMNLRRPKVQAIVPPAPFRVTVIGSTTVPADWDGVHFTSRATLRTRGTAPVAIETLIVFVDGEHLDLAVSWSTTSWLVDLPVGTGESRYELLGFAQDGDLVGTIDLRVVNTTGWARPAVAAVEPSLGPALGGTRVHIRGSGFRQAAKVFLGGAEASGIAVDSLEEITAVTPPGSPGKQTVRVLNPDGQSAELPAAFEYVAPRTFVRGDATGDARVDLADAVKVLFHLYAGGVMSCLDAADADDSGSVELTDAVLVLRFLFLDGPPPAAPFPAPGVDPEPPADDLGC
ncbi:MAG: lamin tail domain-containing protein [Planctomycetes bacterium]|nr:lamin tail domain-containing protein [Planctomycetota bacterium]